MPRKSLLPLTLALIATPVSLAAAQTHQLRGSSGALPVNPASPSTAQTNVYTPPAVDGDEQLCLRDDKTRRLVCHTADQWRAYGIERSARKNFEAKTIEQQP